MSGLATNQALSGSGWFNMRFMSGLGSNLDPELLQARWVLGGIEPEQFVAIAVSALEQGFQGFDGTALQQLAGLSRPTLSDMRRPIALSQ